MVELEIEIANCVVGEKFCAKKLKIRDCCKSAVSLDLILSFSQYQNHMNRFGCLWWLRKMDKINKQEKIMANIHYIARKAIT